MSITEKQIDDVTDPIVGKGVRFERIRRITGYLVGTLDRFNNAKRAEERDRVKHTSFISASGK
jgi:anaerobic ribonucleoside-triphosphate reductase